MGLKPNKPRLTKLLCTGGCSSFSDSAKSSSSALLCVSSFLWHQVTQNHTKPLPVMGTNKSMGKQMLWSSLRPHADSRKKLTKHSSHLSFTYSIISNSVSDNTGKPTRKLSKSILQISLNLQHEELENTAEKVFIHSYKWNKKICKETAVLPQRHLHVPTRYWL